MKLELWKLISAHFLFSGQFASSLWVFYKIHWLIITIYTLIYTSWSLTIQSHNVYHFCHIILELAEVLLDLIVSNYSNSKCNGIKPDDVIKDYLYWCDVMKLGVSSCNYVTIIHHVSHLLAEGYGLGQGYSLH